MRISLKKKETDTAPMDATGEQTSFLNGQRRDQLARLTMAAKIIQYESR